MTPEEVGISPAHIAALWPYIEKQLGLEPPHFMGRPSCTTRNGTPYVTIKNGVCPAEEGVACAGVPIEADAARALDDAALLFLQGFSRYRDENKKHGDRIVWRMPPEIRVWQPVDGFTFEALPDRMPEIAIYARFCFEARV